MSNLKDITLLVVDDEEIMRSMLANLFTKKGFSVLTAESGNSAFDLVRKSNIQLIISDMRMPFGDGMSLLERVRNYDPKIPVVIFMTGFSEIDPEICIAKGAKKVLNKPFDRTLLLSTVFDSLGLKPA